MKQQQQQQQPKNNMFNIKVTEIDLNNISFLMSTFYQLDNLLGSISNYGIITPLILRKTSNSPRYQLLNGFKRVMVAKKLNISTIKAMFLDADLSDIEIFDKILSENLSLREMNIIEKYYIINNLRKFKIDENTIIKKYFPLLKMKGNFETIKLASKTLNLNDNVLQKVAQDLLSIDTLKYLLSIKEPEQLNLIKLFENFSLAKNKQRQFINLIKDIIKIKNQNLSPVIQDLEALFLNEKATKSQCAEKLFKHLYSIRYPMLNKYSAKFNELLKELKLSKIKLSHSHNFEKDSFEINFNFKNLSDLEDASHDIEKTQRDINKLINLTK